MVSQLFGEGSERTYFAGVIGRASWPRREFGVDHDFAQGRGRRQVSLRESNRARVRFHAILPSREDYPVDRGEVATSCSGPPCRWSRTAFIVLPFRTGLIHS